MQNEALPKGRDILHVNDAYMFPQHDYCCVILVNCDQLVENKIIKFQNRAARLKDTFLRFVFPIKWMPIPDKSNL